MNSECSQMVRNSVRGVDAIAALLRGLIDYAGLFPPASLAMLPALVNYAMHSESEYNWVLGRFILPVARLGEFEETLAQLPGAMSRPKSRWELSVLPGKDISADVAQIRQFNERFAASHSSPKVEIKSVELKISSPEKIEPLSALIPAGLETYFEIPLSSNERDCIAAVANCGRRAKVRTGGETADKFPSPESVLDFMRLCAAANVPFKATAGLHHPLRSLHRFTYQPLSPSGVMHGFLNIFLAAAFLRAGMEPSVAVLLLKEESAQAFHFDLEGAIWRDHRLTVGDIATARQGFSTSFGSCSFTEPIDDLRTLHLL